jgi:hypothetical protein
MNAFALQFPQAELELLHELALHQGAQWRARICVRACSAMQKDQNKRTIDQMVHRLRHRLRQQTADAMALNPVRGSATALEYRQSDEKFEAVGSQPRIHDLRERGGCLVVTSRVIPSA